MLAYVLLMNNDLVVFPLQLPHGEGVGGRVPPGGGQGRALPPLLRQGGVRGDGGHRGQGSQEDRR